MKLEIFIANMDLLLLDIKNFLKKLENGQLEIEAGQWELHKDLTNLKMSFEELKKLKEDFEKMRVGNIELMGIVRGLEAKFEVFKQRWEESSKKGFPSPKSSQSSSSNPKRLIPHISVSDEVVEIITESTASSKSNSEKAEPKFFSQEEAKAQSKSQNSSEFYPNPEFNTGDRISRKQKYSQKNNEMLQRYLKDSAKYSEKCSKEIKRTEHSSNSPKPETRDEKIQSAFSREEWTDFGTQNPDPQAEGQINPELHSNKPSSDSMASTESPDPYQIPCPKCSKKFMYKSDLVKHDRHVHMNISPTNLCRLCNKNFQTKDMLRIHRKTHENNNKKNVFRCRHCKKCCTTLGSLMSHLVMCKVFSRVKKQQK